MHVKTSFIFFIFALASSLDELICDTNDIWNPDSLYQFASVSEYPYDHIEWNDSFYSESNFNIQTMANDEFPDINRHPDPVPTIESQVTEELTSNQIDNEEKIHSKAFYLIPSDGSLITTTQGNLYDHLKSNPGNGWLLKNEKRVRFDEEKISRIVLKEFTKISHKIDKIYFVYEPVSFSQEEQIAVLEKYGQFLIISRKLDFFVDKFYLTLAYYAKIMPETFMLMISTKNAIIRHPLCLGMNLLRLNI